MSHFKELIWDSKLLIRIQKSLYSNKILQNQITRPLSLHLTWCTISLESLSQTVFLEYCPKNTNKGDKYQNTVFNPGVKG